MPSLADNVRELWRLNLFDYFQIYPGVVPAEKNEIFIQLGGLGHRRGAQHSTRSRPFFLQATGSPLSRCIPRSLNRRTGSAAFSSTSGSPT